jgi:drug/metabolite transporter (DMT)-like permease
MSPPPSAEHLRALAMLLLANFFWGLSFPLIKAIMLIHDQIIPAAGSWFSAAYTVAPRFLIAVAVMFALRPRDSWRANAREWRQGTILGLFAAAGMLLQNDALQHTSASTSAFLTQFYAILIPIWIALRGRHNPGARIWLCCALVLVGVAILGRFDPGGFFPSDGSGLRFGRGEWETLLCSLFFMGQILTLERKDFAGNRPEKITFVMFLVEALIFWVLAGCTTPDLPTLITPWQSLPWVVFTLALTVFCTLGSFSLMNAWQPKITATEAGLIYCVEPIFASVMALFLPAVFSAWAGINYPNERATWTLLVGGGLVTLANVILQLRPPAKD